MRSKFLKYMAILLQRWRRFGKLLRPFARSGFILAAVAAVKLGNIRHQGIIRVGIHQQRAD